MNKSSKVFIAGHRGLVGSAIHRKLLRDGYSRILTRPRAELDLTEPLAVDEFFEAEKPEYVFLAAAKVGGILANDNYPADYIRENLLIQTHVIDAAYKSGVKKLMFLGSSCIYPKHAPQPLPEESLLTGPLEPTNESYAVAKIAGIKMCQAYYRQYGFDSICVMPTNLYGPYDNFDLETSHVLPALLRKFHEARLLGRSTVEVWGTGTAKREFLHVDDLAEACCLLMEQSSESVRSVAPDGLINIGAGKDIEIRELASLIRDVVDVDCELSFDTSKPDGTPNKLLDLSRIRVLGWTARISLRDGLRITYEWYCAHSAETVKP